MRKVSFYTLGCKVNQYETQALREKFENNGYDVVGENDFAHVYIVNSCSVTGISDRKARQHIRKTKRLNPDAVTALIGCYAETGTDAARKIDEIDIIVGNTEKSQVFDEIEKFLNQKSQSQSDSVDGKSAGAAESTGKLVKVGGILDAHEYDDYGIVSGMDSRTRAYIKIEDGCDRFCSYCVIPYARGPVRSRPVQSILAEAQRLLDKGYKELILTGINSALYGRDKDSSDDLISLVKQISELKSQSTQSKPDAESTDFRIRLSSLEPTVINKEYAEELIKLPKLCPHLHLSLQSGSDRILSSMGRNYTRREYLDIIKVLKDYDPDYSITTDIIVGYPGETDADFVDSLNIIEEAGFSKVHVFKYSKREGTRAADMKDQVPPQIKNERSKLLMEAAEAEAQSFLKRNKGTRREALILEYDEENGLYTGITDNDINVNVSSNEDLLNKFCMVTVE